MRLPSGNEHRPPIHGDGRSTRIWLDLILKARLGHCIDWSQITKMDYHAAMKKSVTNPARIKTLLCQALTDKIHDREMFMKGVDYSYYYEQEYDIENAFQKN